MKKPIEEKPDEQQKENESENQSIPLGERMRSMTAKETGSIFMKMMLENLNTNPEKNKEEE